MKKLFSLSLILLLFFACKSEKQEVVDTAQRPPVDSKVSEAEQQPSIKVQRKNWPPSITKINY